MMTARRELTDFERGMHNIPPWTAQWSPALNDRDRRRLQRVVNSNGQATLRQITAEINVGRTRDLSVRTVRRNLAFLGYSSRRPTRVPLLTERHRLQRLSWAREHIGWSLDEWKTLA
ncbi:transposable element Tc1 transposase [Caerostris darwini]|uniref:Transposable element Tc1 transposase n=1 Tax=Caerostris darwini TaxID=1538125 RepID=A0AAV4USR3_9ARAC|nr:transposable element Tc1 transposase [Caerostris darwini]